MTLDGYCLAYRSAWSNPVFRDLLEAGVWNWIYQSCAWKETTVRVNGCIYELKRGELVTTISFISQGFRISPQSTRTLIKNLEKSGMINTRTNKQATIISVCNYDKFQDLNYHPNKRPNKRVTNDQQTGNNNKNTLNTLNTDNTIIHKGDFEIFWSGWVPYEMTKGVKSKAEESYHKALLDTSPENLLLKRDKYISQCTKNRTKTKHVVTWLNQKGWEDDYAEIKPIEKKWSPFG